MTEKKKKKKKSGSVKSSPGQPTKYDPKYCKMVIEAGKRGETLTEFAANINVDRQTIYNWRKEHKAFFGALKRHKALCAAYFVQHARKMSQGKADGNTAIMAMFLKNVAAFQDNPVGQLDDDIVDDNDQVELEWDHE